MLGKDNPDFERLAPPRLGIKPWTESMSQSPTDKRGKGELTLKA